MRILENAAVIFIIILMLSFTFCSDSDSEGSSAGDADNTDYLELCVNVFYDDSARDSIFYGDFDPEEGKAGTTGLYVFLYSTENYTDTSPFSSPRSPYPKHENFTMENNGTVLFDGRGETWYEILEKGEYFVMALYDYRNGSYIMNRSDPYALYIDNSTTTNDPSEAVPVYIDDDMEISITLSDKYRIQDKSAFDID